MIEHAAGEQRGRKQGAALLGQCLDLARGAGARDPAAGNDDRTFRAGELLGQLLDLIRVRRDGLRGGQDVGRRLVVADIGQRLLLQVVGNAEHDRLALMAREVERLAHILIHALRAVGSIHALRAVGGNVMRAGGGGERRLVERLIVPFGVDRRFAREHDQRDSAA